MSNAWREKRAMLHWWQAQIDLVRSMMLDIQAEERRLRLTGSKAFPPSENARQQQEKEDPLLLLGTKTVTIIPAGLNLDTVHNMDIVKVPANARSASGDPAQQVERAANGVHPAEPGQAQIADALWSWLKFRTSLL